MQLACKHVLNPVTSSLDEDVPKLDPEPLHMEEAAQAATQESAHAPTHSNGAANGSHLGSRQPAWLQSRDELDSWVLQNLKDGDRRLKLVHALTGLALPFQYGASRVVRALGNLFSENVS